MGESENYRPYGNIPIPDPTKLTTEAVEAAKAQWRQDLACLKELLEAKIVATQDLLDERYVTQTKALDAAFAAAEKAVSAALQSAERAVTKAEVASDKRFESVNAFRGQLSDQVRDFLPRPEYQAAHQALIDRMGLLTSRIERIEGKSLGSSTVVTFMLGAIPVVVGIASVVLIVVTR